MLGSLDDACGADVHSCALLRLRVLLAVGDPPVASALSEGLLAVGCTVTLASNGVEALEKAEAGLAFDLLVADAELPMLDGTGLARAVQKRSPWRPTIVLADEPPGGALGVLQRRRRGRVLVVEKPVCSKRLLAAVARAVCRRTGAAERPCPALG